MNRAARQARLAELIQSTGSKWLKTTSMIDDDVHFIVNPKGRLILVVINKDTCDHFVQGGSKWADLEFDLRGDGQ